MKVTAKDGRSRWKCLNIRSLRGKLLSISLLLVAVILVVVGILQHIFMKQYTYQNKAESMLNQVISIPPETWRQGGLPIPKPEGADQMNASDQASDKRAQEVQDDDQSGEAGKFDEGEKTSGDAAGKRDRAPVPMLFLPGLTLAYVDQEGQYKTLSEWSDGGTAPRLSKAEIEEILLTNQYERKLSSNYMIVDNEQGEEQLVVFSPVPLRHPIGLVQISTATAPMKGELSRQLMIYIVLSLIALTAGSLVFMPLLRKTLQPLSNMVHTVEQINAGNLQQRLSVTEKQEEIDKLASSFNDMLERLEASFEAEKEAKEQMRQFIADASHELRTPLTSIHGFIEVLLRGASKHPEQLDRALKSMYGESERMNKLVHDLLLLAKLDRAPELTASEGKLGLMIDEMEPQLRLLAQQRKVSFDLDCEISCIYDRDKLKQVVLNLFYNAVQHTDPEAGKIKLSLKQHQHKWVQLQVQDNGIGIDDEHIPLLFNRFYRMDPSRARKHGGAGLGLSITKSIIDLHGGRIEVRSDLGSGTTFIVTLPLDQRQP